MELKKLQKMKEFQPNISFPFVQSLMNKEQEKKKKGCPEQKRPCPPYILWFKDQWNEVNKEKPAAEFKEISNILSAKWKTVSAEEKKPYEEKYPAEKEAYLQVMAKEKRESEAMKLLEEDHKQKTAMELLDQYLQFMQEAEKDSKKTKKDKDLLKPKQPMSAYFLFSNERKAALVAEKKSVLEVAKITGAEWKNMTEKQRAPYEEVDLRCYNFSLLRSLKWTLGHELLLSEALREGLEEEMDRDPTVGVMGEDAGHYGGSCKVNEGLANKYGHLRVLDTPIAENSFIGMRYHAMRAAKLW